LDGLLPGGVLGLGGYLGPKFFWQANDTVCSSFGYTFRIGGVEQNLGPGIEGYSIIHVLCNGSDRILKSGTRCETCGRWYNKSCGNVKSQVAESRTWNCNTCRSERLQLLEEKLQNVLLQTDELTRKNKELEEQLQLVAAGKELGKQYTVLVKH
jgi:hypothetical protein